MSQLFDSLRRGRPTTVPAAPRSSGRVSNGEALFASLGYTPVRRTRPDIVVAVGLLALVGAATYAWYVWPKASPRSAQQKVAAVAPARPVATASAPAKPSPVQPLPPPPQAPAPVRTPIAKAFAAPVAAPAPSLATRPSRVTTESEDFNLAVYHQRSGDFERALLKYRAVLEKNELNAQARNNLGLLYLDKDLVDDALRELQRAVIIDPRYARARINLGVALMRRNRLDSAAAEFRAALAQEPRNVDALINLALVEEATATPERAKELLIRALGISPRNASAHYNLAVVFDHSGEVARAVEHYRSFLEYAEPDVSARAPDVRARLDALTRR